MIKKTKRAKAIRSFKGEARPHGSQETCRNLPKKVDGRCVCKTASGKIKKLPKDSCGLFTPSTKSNPVFKAKSIKPRAKRSGG